MLIPKKKETKQISIRFDIETIEFMEKYGKQATVAKKIIELAVADWTVFERLFINPE